MVSTIPIETQLISASTNGAANRNIGRISTRRAANVRCISFLTILLPAKIQADKEAHVEDHLARSKPRSLFMTGDCYRCRCRWFLMISLAAGWISSQWAEGAFCSTISL